MSFALFSLAATACSAILVTVVSGGSPASFLVTADPLLIILLLAAAMAIASFAAGWITGDYSWVDRLWSVLPVLYSWILALRAFPDSRLLLVACLITLWGARLTFNFARKGGYAGMEDYRWIEVREKIRNPILWQMFNLGFISAYQNLLFVLFVLPMYAIYRFRETPLAPADVAASVLFILFLVIETVADQQQWNFQERKKSLKDSGEEPAGDYARGFLTSGLFRFSRHPNYFCEICIWWTVYMFATGATGSWLSYSAAGAFLLTLLFQGSTALTERISERRHPMYAEYRKRTSRLVPWFARSMEGEVPPAE